MPATMTQTEVTIFLADQRGCSQTDWFRSYHSFNFGSYQAENRAPFGALRVFNDETLAGEKSLKMTVDENSDVLLLPLTGALEYAIGPGETGLSAPGELLVLSAAKGTEFEITNPYSDELINFLQIWVRHNAPSVKTKRFTGSFEVEQKNQLYPLFSTHATAMIGKFEGRQEGMYTVQYPEKNGVFVFVIEGAFEVQNRLLHPRDGLSLAHISKMDFEALSNDALLLVLEIPL
ncbi:pirin family protein [Runella slithyformis]|uniref:Pirin family protein n=1 Tax=Runella slithyformis (strain ATCC 29530 / DSM 19594 / LMG 11500 / NCIMB 11436 / LSU 4) TaxID=761193 RepID=A0A7U3ZL13_RUNSL|nr:pirin family protein [Runella slithyformis]AEI49102.1 pirin family protein [Runella slithyformis DSM 19594]